jgi:hypothetical protein
MPSGYRLYIDNGQGNITMIFDGSVEMPGTLSYVYTSNITCGHLYRLKVTAVNVAGEGSSKSNQIAFGVPTTAPLNPRLVSINPGTSLTIVWDDPQDLGCLPM